MVWFALVAFASLAPTSARADEVGQATRGEEPSALAARVVDAVRIALGTVHRSAGEDPSARSSPRRCGSSAGSARATIEVEPATSSALPGLGLLGSSAWEAGAPASDRSWPLWSTTASADETPYLPGLDPRLSAAFAAVAPAGTDTDGPAVALTPTVPMPRFAPDGAIAEWDRRLEPSLDWRRVMVAGLGLTIHPGSFW